MSILETGEALDIKILKQMKISRLSAFGLISFLIFLFCLLFNYNGWRFQFWLIRVAYIVFFIIGTVIFFRPKNRVFTKIVSSFFPISLILIPLSFAVGGIFFVGIVLAVLLFPIIGPTFQSKQYNYVIQRPYQGFLGSATRFELVDKGNIFEKKICTFQADTTSIKSFMFDAASQKLSINNGQELIQLKDFVE
ncbi:hypothetical protein WBJ53_25345 [Spirosoma sp. SC4-14]|uniref:hypothetical protein n=1 Tax=Spirosoma sp. SC4-14 TaxID=3128900 RepID=UPI0030CBF978